MSDTSVIDAIETMDVIVPIDDEDDDNEHPAQNWTVPPLNNDTKGAMKVDNSAKIAASVGKQIVGKTGTTLTALTNATGGSLMGKAGWGALLSGTAMGTGPIVLLVASVALAVADAAKNGVSAYKTDQHIKNLQKILTNAGSYKCSGMTSGHNNIVQNVLPYIITKKQKKKIRKMGAAVPMIGSAIEQARSKIKASVKRVKGTLGKNRKLQAEHLAAHHCGQPCGLTTAIIAELFGLTTEEAEAARGCKADELAAILSVKFKSV